MRPNRLGPLLAMSLLLAALPGCRPLRPSLLHAPPATLTAADYPDVLRSWTRSGRLYQSLDNKLFVSSTFHAPEFRRAFAAAFPDVYGSGGIITRRELVDLSGGVEQYHNFFLSVYTPDVRWNDLSKVDSIWHLTLHGTNHSSVSPYEVVPVKLDENLRAVYRYPGRFDRGYLVRFPLTDPQGHQLIDTATTHFTLRIGSALGVAELRWDVVDPPAPPEPTEL